MDSLCVCAILSLSLCGMKPTNTGSLAAAALPAVVVVVVAAVTCALLDAIVSPVPFPTWCDADTGSVSSARAPSSAFINSTAVIPTPTTALVAERFQPPRSLVALFRLTGLRLLTPRAALAPEP